MPNRMAAAGALQHTTDAAALSVPAATPQQHQGKRAHNLEHLPHPCALANSLRRRATDCASSADTHVAADAPSVTMVPMECELGVVMGETFHPDKGRRTTDITDMHPRLCRRE